MSIVPRLRLLLARRPWLRWLVVGLCAAAVAAQLLAIASGLERERQRWGTPRSVWVATAPAAVGDTVAMQPRQWPDAVVPANALSDPPTDAVAARAVATGQLLTTPDIAGEDAIPPGWQVFAVPTDGQPLLQIAQPVSVYAHGNHLCHGTATGAPSGDNGFAEVAVPDRCAAAVSAALADGAVVLARST